MAPTGPSATLAFAASSPALSIWLIGGCRRYGPRGGSWRWLVSALIAPAPTFSVFATPQLAWDP